MSKCRDPIRGIVIFGLKGLLLVILVCILGIHIINEKFPTVELPAGETKLMQYINIMNNTVHFLNTEEEKENGVDAASYFYTPDKYKEKYGLTPLPEKLYIAKENIVGIQIPGETDEEYNTKINSLLDKHFEKVPFEDTCYKENLRDIKLHGEVFTFNYGTYIRRDATRKHLEQSGYMQLLKEKNKDMKIYNGLRVRHMVNNIVAIDKETLSHKVLYNDEKSTYIKEENKLDYGHLINLFDTYYLPVAYEGRLAGLLVVSDTENYIPEVLTEDLLTAIRILSISDKISNENPIRTLIIEGKYFLATDNIMVEIPKALDGLIRSGIKDISYIKRYEIQYDFINPDFIVEINEQDILEQEPDIYLGLNKVILSKTYDANGYIEKSKITGYNVMKDIKKLSWKYEYDIKDYLENRYRYTIYSGNELLDNVYRNNLEEGCLYDLDKYAKDLLTDAFSRLSSIPKEIENIIEYDSGINYRYDYESPFA